MNNLCSLGSQRWRLPPSPSSGEAAVGSGIRKKGKGKVLRDVTPLTKPTAVERRVEHSLGVQVSTFVFFFLFTLEVQR